jgi:hypothetical protein
MTRQKSATTRRALRFVGTAIDDLDVFQEQVHRHQLPPMKEICQVCQAVKLKYETENCYWHSGKVVLAPLYGKGKAIPLQA